MVLYTQSLDSTALPQLPDAMMRAAMPATKGLDIDVPAVTEENLRSGKNTLTFHPDSGTVQAAEYIPTVSH
jgi:hypothetical protein